MKRRYVCVLIAIILGGAGCGPSSEEAIDVGQADVGVDVGAEAGGVEPEQPYAASVESFEAGEGAGFGEESFPEIVLGPPKGDGTKKGSTHVLSLGDGGEIVLGFGDRAIVDGDGPDFIVFENPFYLGGEPEEVFQELGEVAVSRDGENWKTFECDKKAAEPGKWPGCAGWRPTLKYDPTKVIPLEPSKVGGDPFDLEDVGLDEARFVRIRDVEGRGGAPATGFDLDAVGMVHAEPSFE